MQALVTMQMFTEWKAIMTKASWSSVWTPTRPEDLKALTDMGVGVESMSWTGNGAECRACSAIAYSVRAEGISRRPISAAFKTPSCTMQVKILI